MEPDYQPPIYQDDDDEWAWERLDAIVDRVIDNMGQEYRSLMIERGRAMELPPEWRNQ